MELFRNTNIDFLGKKWYFLAFSLIFSVAGLSSMGARWWNTHTPLSTFIEEYPKTHENSHFAAYWIPDWFRWLATGEPLPYGVDFKGGTLVYVKFAQTPDLNQIRSAMDRAGLKDPKIQSYGPAGNNEVLVALEQRQTSESALDQGKNTIIKTLASSATQQEGKQDLNNTGPSSLQQYLLAKDPMHLGIDAAAKYLAIGQQIDDFRNKQRGGVLTSVDELKGVAPAEVLAVMQQDFYTSNFAVRNVEIVGPQVGSQLRMQAVYATLYSLGGMLVYLWFRFELIYGVGAVVACFHDTIITVGFFSLLNKDITLTVIAAILTLIGYSMNDTIVVYDRIRENIKLLRRENLADVVNKSINQTLSRTILTSGLTFLTVLSLYVFGGEVLRGFSLALVIGILIGTYSSIAVAAPMLVAYQEWRSRKSGRASLPAASAAREKIKVKA